MIVITAPTGLIGHQVLSNVLGSGEPVRVIVRDPSRLPAEARERVEVVQGSHGDINVVDQAFAGADAVFWLVPPDPHADSAEAAYVDFTPPACDAFKRHGVQRVVGISALGRGTAAARHAGLATASLAMDDLIASTGVSYRALTMPSFMDNLLRQVRRSRTAACSARRSPGTASCRPARPVTSPPPPPGCCWMNPGAGTATSPSSGRRTCPSPTWRRSCPRCSASPCATSRFPPRPQGAGYRGRDVRRDGAGHGRHDGRQGPGPG